MLQAFATGLLVTASLATDHVSEAIVDGIQARRRAAACGLPLHARAGLHFPKHVRLRPFTPCPPPSLTLACCGPHLPPLSLQVINKAIAAELIFIATANIDKALWEEGW